VLARDHLAAGFEGEGPLILEEQTSTVVIEPGWKVRVDGTGNLTLRN
jgi:5-oxoprolinase (ATP-hydrolysing)